MFNFWSFISLVIILSIGFRLLLSSNFLKKIIGISLVGHCINLCILFSGWTKPHNNALGIPPFTEAGVSFEDMNDPLPQALILTAIVISFAVTGFLVFFHLISERESK